MDDERDKWGRAHAEWERREAQRVRAFVAHKHAWAAEHGVELVGFAGRLTGAGAIEYPVYREPDGNHFAIQGDAPGGPKRVALGQNPHRAAWYWPVDEWLRSHHLDLNA